jgi:hypothetical protein
MIQLAFVAIVAIANKKGDDGISLVIINDMSCIGHASKCINMMLMLCQKMCAIACMHTDVPVLTKRCRSNVPRYI